MTDRLSIAHGRESFCVEMSRRAAAQAQLSHELARPVTRAVATLHDDAHSAAASAVSRNLLSSSPTGGSVCYLVTHMPSTTRYFLDKLPVAVMGDQPVAYFVCSGHRHDGARAGAVSQRAQSLARVAPGLDRGRDRGESRPACTPAKPPSSGTSDSRPATVTASTEDLGVVLPHAPGGGPGRRRPASRSPRSIASARCGKPFADRSSTSCISNGGGTETWRWRTTPRPRPHRRMRSVGTLVTELLPFDYSQFGSLPGVA